MPIDDDAAPIGEFELQYARTFCFAVAVDSAFIQRSGQIFQRSIGQAVELARCHRRDKLVRTHYPLIMRRAASLIVVLFALSACGTKGALYLPPPEQKPQQDNKTAPRQ